jgi:hypothetical protein
MNPFMRRKTAARPLTRRELRRRTRLTPRQENRVITNLKSLAGRQVREVLSDRERAAAIGIELPPGA